jgi:hypothetical protein
MEGMQALESTGARIDELAAKGEKMGQSFTSTFAKIKESLLEAFAKGVNTSRDGVQKGLDDMYQAFRDPQLLQSIKSIGQAMAEWVPIAAKSAASVIASLAMIPNVLKQLDKGELLKKFLQGEAGNYIIDTANKYKEQMLKAQYQSEVGSFAGIAKYGPGTMPDFSTWWGNMVDGVKKENAELDTQVQHLGVHTTNIGSKFKALEEIERSWRNSGASTRGSSRSRSTGPTGNIRAT